MCELNMQRFNLLYCNHSPVRHVNRKKMAKKTRFSKLSASIYAWLSAKWLQTYETWYCRGLKRRFADVQAHACNLWERVVYICEKYTKIDCDSRSNCCLLIKDGKMKMLDYDIYNIYVVWRIRILVAFLYYSNI